MSFFFGLLVCRTQRRTVGWFTRGMSNNIQLTMQRQIPWPPHARIQTRIREPRPPGSNAPPSPPSLHHKQHHPRASNQQPPPSPPLILPLGPTNSLSPPLPAHTRRVHKRPLRLLCLDPQRPLRGANRLCLRDPAERRVSVSAVRVSLRRQLPRFPRG
ncbi:hypothetical protein BDV12DRAFT_155146 [Aspergillus spectabilis]